MPGGNPRGATSHGSLEEQWLQTVKRELGEDFVERILRFERMEPEAFKTFNEHLKQFVQRRKEINPSRMRKVYEVIRGAESLPDLLLGLPKLAYMVGKEENRSRRDQIGALYMTFAASIDRAKDEKDLQGIRKFAEALVAYHKFYGGRQE